MSMLKEGAPALCEEEKPQEPMPNLAEAVRQRFLRLGGVDRLEPHPPVPAADPGGKPWDKLFGDGQRASENFMSEREQPPIEEREPM
jgi:hypothetical protein